VAFDSTENITHFGIDPAVVVHRISVFSPFPKHLEINGRFDELRLGGHLDIRDWGGSSFKKHWTSGVVANRIQHVSRRPDINVMLFPKSDDDVLTFGPDLCGKTLAIRGPSTVKKIVIEPELEMEHILIVSMPWLEEIILKGRVIQLNVEDTPNLRSISGYGKTLYTNIKRRIAPFSTLKIKGFWQTLRVAEHDSELESFILSENVLKNTEDLEGRIIHSDDYFIQCKWAEDFDVDIKAAVLGFSFKHLVELWIKEEHKARSVFLDWLGDERYIIDRRYFALRIAMSLLLKGHKMKSVRARNLAFEEKTSEELVPQKLVPLISNYSRQHYSRQHEEKFAPYDILELEFLARAKEDDEMPSLKGEISEIIDDPNALLLWTIALQNIRKSNFGSTILEICDQIVTQMQTHNGYYNSRTRFHRLFSTRNVVINIIKCLEEVDSIKPNSNLILKLADIILEQENITADYRAAQIIALMQIDDNPLLGTYLSKLIPSLENFEMEEAVYPFSVLGREAIDELEIDRLPFPYEPSSLLWRKEDDNNR